MFTRKFFKAVKMWNEKDPIDYIGKGIMSGLSYVDVADRMTTYLSQMPERNMEGYRMGALTLDGSSHDAHLLCHQDKAPYNRL